ncbi:MAG: glycerol-3-phosphate 1-O-acyltransferase PlsY [Clostridia bacterium]|nr:glycerol-3-phosphate 1-O-acyltransferase PlsY [Clostridia bacterium]
MTMVIAAVITVIAAYLIGSINTSIIISKIKRNDIRTHGSGNAGATNTLRVMGKAAAAGVVIGDVLKAFLAAILASLVAGWFNIGYPENLILKYLALASVVIGHNFPLYFGFRGGKGIVTSVAVMFVIDWRIASIVLGVGIIAIVLTRYVSLGSIMGCLLFPLVCYVRYMDSAWSYEKSVIILALFLGILGILRHKNNIKKLMSGTERKIGEKSKE